MRGLEQRLVIPANVVTVRAVHHDHIARGPASGQGQQAEDYKTFHKNLLDSEKASIVPNASTARRIAHPPIILATSLSCRRSGSLEMIFCAVEFAPMR